MAFFKITERHLKFILCNSLNYIICLAWGTVLLSYLAGLINNIPFVKNFTDLLIYLIIIIPVIFSLKYWSKFVRGWDVVFIIFCLVTFLLNYIIFPQNIPYLDDRLFRFSILVLPFFFVGIALDIEKYINTFYIISIICLAVNCFYQLIYIHGTNYSGDADASKYNMEMAYHILPHVLMVSWIALKNRKLWNILLTILGVFLLLSLGTRGPLICEIIFIVAYFVFFNHSKYKVAINLIIITSTIYLLTFLDQFMLVMQLLMHELGLSSRIFDTYLEGDFGTSEGRDYIYSTLLFVLENNDAPIGFGVLGSYNFVKTYPHNIFLDFIFSFGWVLGIIMLILVFSLIYIAICRCRNQNEKEFILLLFCASIIHLCISGTYLDSTMFFVLLGFCIRCSRRKLT